ncbi:MAG TPA: hypothetical protein PK718_04440 [Candidatus Methanofastidiosa archaeon]|nr:hypothetical protein [Candidatus Methanofastidiosa archaeon]
MLGISDPFIVLAYVSSIALAVACIVYGVLNWNKGGEGDGC